MAEVVVVRHCASSGQAPEAPLSKAGFGQAAALAEYLLPLGIDRIVSSPYQRAVETVLPFATQRGLELELERDDRLIERVLSAEPLDDWLAQLEQTWIDFDYRAPGGETSREAQQRGRAALDEIAQSGARRPLVVSHGNLIALLLNSVDPSVGFAQWQTLTNPDVFLLDPAGSGPSAIERLWPA